MESKKDIRKYVLEKRNQLTCQEWKEKSHRIYEKVVSHPFFLCADMVFCYVDYRREVGTRAIIEKAWELKKKVAVPKVEGDNMTFYYIQKFSDLWEGYRGIMEPDTTYPADVPHALVIMPGAAFDKNGNRIGYGKGYYDKFLHLHKNYHTMALSFELQLVDKIPADTYDVRPEILITEENVYVKSLELSDAFSIL